MAADNLLFVYGTLRPGFDSPLSLRMARRCDHLGAARIQGRLYDLGDYPGLVLSDHRQEQVTGDLFRMHNPGRLLDDLDEYEGCSPHCPEPTEYLRRRCPVTRSDGRSVVAWVYLYNFAVSAVQWIESGDYAVRA